MTTAKDHPELAEYLLDQRPPLEAQLIDLTDEIAYNTADLDDGYEAHLLSLEQIRRRHPDFRRLLSRSRADLSRRPDKLKFNETLKRVLNRFVGDLITNTQARISEAGIQTLEDVRNHRAPGRLQPRSGSRPQAMQRISSTKISTSAPPSNPKKTPQNPPHQLSADSLPRVVSELFAFWMKNTAAIPRPSLPTIRSSPPASALATPRNLRLHRLGMTDNYIFEQHAKYSALSKYTVIQVAVGKIGIGNINWISEPELRENLKLRDAAGNYYEPVQELSGDAKGLVSILKPVMANMLGKMGADIRRPAPKTKSSNSNPLVVPVFGIPHAAFRHAHGDKPANDFYFAKINIHDVAPPVLHRATTTESTAGDF
jgi:hypothetical protein